MSNIKGKFVFIPDNVGDSFVYPADNKEAKKYCEQRKEHGFGDDETFSLDYTLASFILPRLRRYREITNSSPICVSYDEWMGIIDEIIWLFEQYENDLLTPEHYSSQEYCGRIKNAIDLFAKYLRQLWW